ncbi:hypothetical protein AB4Z54_56210, partial [Streptomyces sp. MCAF7]
MPVVRGGGDGSGQGEEAAEVRAGRPAGAAPAAADRLSGPGRRPSGGHRLTRSRRSSGDGRFPGAGRIGRSRGGRRVTSTYGGMAGVTSDGLPEWLMPVARAAETVEARQLSRFLPPARGGGRPSAVLVLFGEGERGPELLLLE